MKKTLVAAAAAVLFSGAAFAEFDLGAACSEAYNPESGVSTEDWAAACSCLVENANDSAVASFEAANGDQTMWNEDAQAAVGACFPSAE